MEHIEWGTSNGLQVGLDYGRSHQSVREVLRRLKEGHYLPRVLFGPKPSTIQNKDYIQIWTKTCVLTIKGTGNADVVPDILDTPIDFYTVALKILHSDTPVLRAPLLDFEMANTRRSMEICAKRGIQHLLDINNREICFAIYCVFTTFNPELQA